MNTKDFQATVINAFLNNIDSADVAYTLRNEYGLDVHDHQIQDMYRIIEEQLKDIPIQT